MSDNPLAITPRPALFIAAALLDAARLPTADLTEQHCRDFFFTGPPEAPSGLVGLELFGDVALLRSLVVAPGSRSAGTGSALVRHAEDYARASRIRAMFLLTTTAAGFFAKLGYAMTSRDSAPAAIKTTREFAGICPASSAFMTKQL